MKKFPLIIACTELNQALEQTKNLLILDTRPQKDFVDSHIPQAQNFDGQIVNRTEGNTKGLLPTKETLYEALQDIGYDGSQHIVIYNGNSNPAAARVAWTLYAFGIHSVSLLNGGFTYWLSQNLPTSTKVIELEQRKSKNKLSDPSISIACDYRYIEINTDKIKIIDARTSDEFQGRDVRSKYGGHIPKAIHINWVETKEHDGLLFKSDEILLELFESKGIQKNDTIVSYCQSHQRSALICLLLMHLGYTDVLGYPGAWSDWGNREETIKITV